MSDQTKYSECCEAPLRKYNKDWNDGICRKCEKHSVAVLGILKREDEESVDAYSQGRF